MKALIVDDSRSMRRIICGIMQDLGFETTDAEDGLCALQKLEQNGLPDVVLVDWNMPNMNGIEFIRAVRGNSKFRRVPVMMVTSETDLNRMAAAFAAGASEYVMKPFDRMAIEDKLRMLAIGEF